jgi:TatD DNase family protein
MILEAILRSLPIDLENRDEVDNILRNSDLLTLACTGDRAAAREYLARGLHISFSGISTFKTAEEIREAAKLVPIARMLVETDAPYLAPVPHRGRANEPGYVSLVGEALAAAMGRDPDEVAAATRATTRRLLGRA